MSVLLWNIRGAGSEPSLLYLKDMIRTHRPEVIGILEPKQRARKIQEFARKIGYDGYHHEEPTNSCIWIFWKHYVQVRDFTATRQSISCYLQHPGVDGDIKLTVVYAKCNRLDRLLLWDDLREASETNMPWIVGGILISSYIRQKRRVELG